MRRFGVIIACANLGVLLTVAWWIGSPEPAAQAVPVEAVLIQHPRLAPGVFEARGDAALAELDAILARQTEDLRRALQIWMLKYAVRTPGTNPPR